MCPENTDTELIKKCLDGNLFFFFMLEKKIIKLKTFD